MSDTVLAVLQRVSRKLGLDPNITTLSDLDESQWLMDRLKQRYQELFRLLPPTPQVTHQSGQLSLMTSQRLYALPATVALPDLYTWSFVDTTTGHTVALPFIALSRLATMDIDYVSTQGLPKFVYLEGGQLGIYPVPNQTRTIVFQYRPVPSTLSSLTDVVSVPDSWLAYIELAVELDYQLWKGQGFPEVTLQRLNQQYVIIHNDMQRYEPTRFRTHDA
jgi:hypothetical protein